MNEVPWKEYKACLETAEALYDELFDSPRTRKELADRFNKVGKIIRILLEN